jgi:hypothetical protein
MPNEHSLELVLDDGEVGLVDLEEGERHRTGYTGR